MPDATEFDPLRATTVALPKGLESTAVPTAAKLHPKGAFTVKPYWFAYFDRYREKPNGVLCSRMSKVLAQLEREYAPGAVLERFQRYLMATRPEFFSVPHFAETWAAWAPAERNVLLTPYVSRYPTADQADAAAGIPVKPGP